MSHITNTSVPSLPAARYRKLFKTFSGGESNVVLEENHILRLESMREYYAQLYLENGLDHGTDKFDTFCCRV